MLDWSDLTSEVPRVDEPTTPPPSPARPIGGRGSDRGDRTGGLRTSRPDDRTAEVRTGDIRRGAPPNPAGPPPPIPPTTAPRPGGPGPMGLGGPGPLGQTGPGPGGPKPAGAPPGLAGPGAAADPMTTGMIKRAEIRKHLRIQQQLKSGTLVLVALLLLAAYPVYLFTTSVAQDPVFGDLDSLDLPSWATIQHDDAASGSRWCIEQCRFRKRTWASEKEPEATNAVYTTALVNAGWRPRTEGLCPEVADGVASCWQHDEYVMDMWIRAPLCDVPPPRPSIAVEAPAPDPSLVPLPTPTELCPGALVTVMVFNAIDYHPVT